MTTNPIIYALDHDNVSVALQDVDRLVGHVGMFKVGMELYLSHGPSAIYDIANRGPDRPAIMLDLKLHDIPTTVGRTVKKLWRLLAGTGVRYLTVHASGGSEMLRAAAAEAGDIGILAITVLTSMDAMALAEVHGTGTAIQQQVLRLTHLAVEAGCAGVVCAPSDLEVVRACTRRDRRDRGFVYVCPGIRPAGSGADDQARADTPGNAIRVGADHLVIGRPIRDAPDHVAVAQRILAEVERARVMR